ncbi:hypothetical protein BTVI_36314 [Pitangus sulphuratus]|nr:hypothetical protein BTVI_36314 [Pitangus sulphuratus]
MLNTTHVQGKMQVPIPLHISVHLLATTVLIKPNRFSPRKEDIGKTISANEYKRRASRGSQSWMGALCSKTQLHSMCRAPARPRNSQQAIPDKRMDSSALANANSSWLAAERRFQTHLPRAEPGSHQEWVCL